MISQKAVEGNKIDLLGVMNSWRGSRIQGQPVEHLGLMEQREQQRQVEDLLLFLGQALQEEVLRQNAVEGNKSCLLWELDYWQGGG